MAWQRRRQVQRLSCSVLPDLEGHRFLAALGLSGSGSSSSLSLNKGPQRKLLQTTQTGQRLLLNELGFVLGGSLFASRITQAWADGRVFLSPRRSFLKPGPYRNPLFPSGSWTRGRGLSFLPCGFNNIRRNVGCHFFTRTRSLRLRPLFCTFALVSEATTWFLICPWMFGYFMG